MGVKRPLDEDTFQELSFKQAKQLDGNNKPTEIAEDISPQEVSQKAAIPRDFDDGKIGESEFGGELEDDKPDKELEISATSSWVTSSSGEEEAGNGGAFFLPLYPDIFEFNLPRRPPIQFEDPYSYLFNSSPRKEVPIGPDYQANIPEWDPDAFRKDPFLSSYTTDDNEQKLVGTSIIVLPDSIVSSCDDIKIGHGRLACDCSDKGSIRCVRQHVEEAREQLRGSIGEEKFADLGFLDMGEEVALKWTEEEERVFHEVVYSNPVTIGKNFWKHLSVVFPSRTKMELVSYYFNVFMLQRRAVQNRSDFLDIDSDDDEWQGDGRFPRVGGEDDDSVVESFGDEDLQVDHEIGASFEINDDSEDEDGNDDNDDDNGDGDGDGDVGSNGQHASEKDDQEEQMSKQPTEISKEDSGFNSSVNNEDKVVSSNSKVHDTQAGTYSEKHPMMSSCGSVAEDNKVRENVLRRENIRCLESLSNGNEGSGTGFVLDPSDAKAWDDTFLTSRVKRVDFLPTCSMIEEIFGPCTWKSN